MESSPVVVLRSRVYFQGLVEEGDTDVLSRSVFGTQTENVKRFHLDLHRAHILVSGLP